MQNVGVHFSKDIFEKWHGLNEFDNLVYFTNLF